MPVFLLISCSPGISVFYIHCPFLSSKIAFFFEKTLALSGFLIYSIGAIKRFSRHYEIIQTHSDWLPDPAAERQFLPAYVCASFFVLRLRYSSLRPQRIRQPHPSGFMLQRIRRVVLPGLRRHADCRPCSFGKRPSDSIRKNGRFLRVPQSAFLSRLAAAIRPRASVRLSPPYRLTAAVHSIFSIGVHAFACSLVGNALPVLPDHGFGPDSRKPNQRTVQSGDGKILFLCSGGIIKLHASEYLAGREFNTSVQMTENGSGF